MIARLAYALAWVLFLGLIAAVIVDQVRWEIYRVEQRCVVVSEEQRQHYPDVTTWACADGKVHTR